MVTKESRRQHQPAPGAPAPLVTHSTGRAGLTVDSVEEAAEAAAAAREGDVPAQGPYFVMVWMSAELHQCPYCDETGQTTEHITNHIARVHVRPPTPPSADRAAAAGIILPDSSK